MNTTRSGRATKVRAATAAVLIAAAVAATGSDAQTRWSQNAPFAGLDQVDAVATSNDEYRSWVYWTAERFRIQYPDGRDAFDARTLHEDDLAPRITLSCRADGRAEGLSGPDALEASGQLPMHPEAPDVPGFMSLRYWLTVPLLGEWERWPSTVSFPGLEPYETDVQRQRGHYSRSRGRTSSSTPNRRPTPRWRDSPPGAARRSG